MTLSYIGGWQGQLFYTCWSLYTSSGVYCTTCIYIVSQIPCSPLPAHCWCWHLTWWCNLDRWTNVPSTHSCQWWCLEGIILIEVQAGRTPLSSSNWFLAQRAASFYEAGSYVLQSSFCVDNNSSIIGKAVAPESSCGSVIIRN